jgi:signal transduction histidine kinase
VPDPVDLAGPTDGRPSHHRGEHDPSRAGLRTPHAPRGIGNWRLRQKLAAVLVLPVLATVVFAGLAIRSEITTVHQFSAALDELTIGRQAAQVADALEHERDAAMLVAASNKTLGATEFHQASESTDAAVARLQAFVNQTTSISASVSDSANTCVETLGGLGELRSSVQNFQYPATAALNEYDGIIASTIAVNRAVAADTTAAGTTPQAASLYLVTLEDLSQQDSILWIMVEQPTQSATLSTDLNDATTAYATDSATFNSVASPQQQQQVQDTVSGPDVDNRASDVQAALAESTAGNPVTVPASQIQSSAATTTTLGWQAEQALLNQVQATLQELKASTLKNLDLNIAAVTLIVLVVLAIMLAMSAAMVRPLRVLRSSALDLARAKLPDEVNDILASDNPIAAAGDALDPIPPFTAEEVGDVARSFDEVHSQAIRLAAEQAVLRDNVNAIFVNLARRSQVLVERQLSLIDRLERDEQDPDQLGNLFELDHLATRMRRNSESLLVLSGNGLAKKMSPSVPIGDLVGAAVSEVEQYTRIDIGSPPDVQIFGRVVNDLIHLVAELLDNATVFSEPNTKVSVRIAKTRAREVAIQITDRGVGISEKKVHELNERLADPPQLDPQVTRHMGLYVVARLANRHHIRIKLRTNEDIDGGTVALVVIPEDLVVEAPPSAQAPMRPQASFPPAPAHPEPAPDRILPPALTPFPGQPVAAPPPAPLEPEVTPAPAVQEPVQSLWDPHIAPDPRPLTSPDVTGPSHLAQQAGTADEDGVTARLPIYEAVLSQWFRPDSPDSPLDDEAPSEPLSMPTTRPSPAPTSTSTLAAPPPERAPRTDADKGARHAPVAAAPGTDAATDSRTWRSPADEGWRLAAALLVPVGELTSAGLPKRVPKAHLMPGSPSHDNAADTATAIPHAPLRPVPLRGADQVRHRMTSFQRGVRRARHAATTGTAPGQLAFAPRSDTHHLEEMQ